MKKLLAVLAVCSIGLTASAVPLSADEATTKSEGDSSAFVSSSYNAETQTLTVEFAKEGAYEYAAVPKEVNDALQAAESKGKFFNESIRGKYTAKKVTK